MKNINRVAFLNILSILILQGISFISSPLFSRLLGTGGYGNLTYFTVWTGILCSVFSLQTNVTIVNARIEYPEGEQQAYQSSVMTLSLVCFALGTVLIAVLMDPISRLLQMERSAVWIMLLQSLGSFGVGFLSSKYTYEFKADRNLFLSVFMAASSMVVSLLLVLRLPLEQRYYGRLLGNAAVYGAVGVAACAVVLYRGRCFVNRRYWRFCFALAWPMVFQNLSYTILGNSDLMMLKTMSGAEDSGIYGLAFTLAGIIFTIFTALNGSWLPFFFDDMKEGNREKVIRQASNFMELFTVLCVGFVLLVREVFRVYADASYWSGTNLIPLFVASHYINFLCTFPVSYETFHKKTRMIAVATTAAAVLNVVLNYWFIRKFGMFGAAVATCLSHLVQLTIHLLYSRFLLGRGDYPFPVGRWGMFTALFAGAFALFYITPNLWYLRWGLGALIGVIELWRLWKRRGLM